MNDWIPRTGLGKQVAAGTITLDEIFETGRKIKEPEIADKPMPGIQTGITL